MTDIQAALELLKLVVQAAPSRYPDKQSLFDLFRECLAQVRDKPE